MLRVVVFHCDRFFADGGYPTRLAVFTIACLALNYSIMNRCCTDLSDTLRSGIHLLLLLVLSHSLKPAGGHLSLLILGVVATSEVHGECVEGFVNTASSNC